MSTTQMGGFRPQIPEMRKILRDAEDARNIEGSRYPTRAPEGEPITRGEDGAAGLSGGGDTFLL